MGAFPFEKYLTNGFFMPTRFLWVVITNKDYAILAKEEGCGGFSDLPAVDTDLKNVTDGIKMLGAQDEDIHYFRNINYSEVSVKIRRGLMQKVQQNFKEGYLTMMFVYYAGHGIMDTTTFIVLNDGKKYRYPFEKMLRAFGAEPGCFVLGVLDCCRKKWEKPSRGAGPDLKKTVSMLEDDFDDDLYSNCVITYGCPEDSGVDARSTISVSYFAQIRKAFMKNQHVILPNDIMTWTPGNNGNHFTKYKHSLKLTYAPDLTRYTLRNPVPKHNFGWFFTEYTIKTALKRAWLGLDDSSKTLWHKFEESYEKDMAFQSNWNERIYKVAAKYIDVDNNAAFSRNAHFIAFHRDLEQEGLEVRGLRSLDIHKKWDSMSMWNKSHKGVTLWDFIQFNKYFNDVTKPAR